MLLPQIGRVSVDPTVSSFDELDAEVSVRPIGVAILRDRGSLASNGMKNITAEQSSVTRSCSRKKFTYPLKLLNNAKKSRYRVNVSSSGLRWFR
jgi:hypothetical protein